MGKTPATHLTVMDVLRMRERNKKNDIFFSFVLVPVDGLTDGALWNGRPFHWQSTSMLFYFKVITDVLFCCVANYWRNCANEAILYTLHRLRCDMKYGGKTYDLLFRCNCKFHVGFNRTYLGVPTHVVLPSP